MPITLYRSGAFYSYDKVNSREKIKKVRKVSEIQRGEMILDFERGHKKPIIRPFKLTAKQKNTFISRCLVMEQFKQDHLKSFILTYDADQVENTKQDLNTFLSRCRRDFGFNSYAWTLELTKKRQFHYHFLTDSPFIDIPKFNRAWSSSRGRFTKNAIRDISFIRGAQNSSEYAIDSLKNVNSAGSYFLKQEKYKREGIGQRLWATSNTIKHIDLAMIGAEKQVINDQETINYIFSKAYEIKKEEFFVAGSIATRDSISLLDSIGITC